MGLPYAADPRLTAHLAEFLARHREAGAPTAVLFNGGVMKADALRERLLVVLRDVERAASCASSRGTDLDHAVARGAAYYGLVRRGRGIRIRGGTARAYYIGVETAMPAVPGMPPPLKALCVAPLGMEEGTELELPGQEFGLVVGEPAEFRFLGSSSREEDALGTVLERWGDEVEELAPLVTTLAVAGPRRHARAGAAARPSHRDRHARALVRRPRRRAALEARVRRPASADARERRGARSSRDRRHRHPRATSSASTSARPTRRSPCIDTRARRRAIETLAMPQLVSAGRVAERPTLPSALYLAGEHDVPAGRARAAVGARTGARSSASWRACRARACRAGS